MIARGFPVPALAVLAACGGAPANQAELDVELLRVLPPVPAYTASGVVFCRGEGEDTLCRACHVGAFGPDVDGGLVSAEVYEHEFRYRETGELHIAVSGPASDYVEFGHDGTLAGAREALTEARAWCEDQGAQRWLTDRDDLDQTYEGFAQ